MSDEWAGCETLDWPGFKLWAGRFAVLDREQRDRFVFRGHGDSRWLLRPSLDRDASFSSADERSKQVRQLVEEFMHECEALTPRPSLPDVELEQECLARHHGMRSSLLDWTRSPYVAAFFACADAPRDATFVEVVALDRHLLPDPCPMEFHVKRSLLRWNPRGIAQQAVFVRVEDHSPNLDDVVSSAVHRARLSVADVPMALADLDLMGINERTMLADIGGAVRAATRRVLR